MYSSGDRSDRVWVRGGRGRDRNSWPARHSRTDSDGDVAMGAGHSRYNNRRRFTPGYSRGRHQGSSSSSGAAWHKVTVHNASSFEQKDFFGVLNMSINESIDPQNIHTLNNRLIFFVKNERAGAAIRKLSGKLTVREHIVSLFTTRTDAPQSSLPREELKGHISAALEKRYIMETNTLNLSAYSKDSDLVKLGVRPHIHKQAPILAELIKEKCADMLLELDFSKNGIINLNLVKPVLVNSKSLKSVKLDNNNIRRLTDIAQLSAAHKNLEYLTLINNPVKNLMEPAQYISDIRKMFPALKLLDGLALPEKVKFELDVDESLPTVQQSCINIVEPVKGAVLNFFGQFVEVFDAPDVKNRQQLTPAYSEMCLFSLSAYWPRPNATPHELVQRSRNLKSLSQADVREKRLIVGREAVITELCSLSPTQHYKTALQLDVSQAINNTMTVTMSGVMKCSDCSRSFSRTFVVRYNNESASIVILNDQISLTHVAPVLLKQLEAPPQPVTNTPSDQLGLIQRVQVATKMNADYSRKCLEGSSWDYNRALAIFKEFQASGKIPPEAFL